VQAPLRLEAAEKDEAESTRASAGVNPCRAAEQCSAEQAEYGVFACGAVHLVCFVQRAGDSLPESSTMIVPSRARAAEERRRRYPDGAFADEQKRVHYVSLQPSEAIARLCKGNDADRQYGEDLIHAIEHFKVSDGVMSPRRLRSVDSEEGRRLFRFYLHIIGGMERGKGPRGPELRIDGTAGWWGRTEAPGDRAQYNRTRPTPVRRKGPFAFDTAKKTVRLSESARPYSMRQALKRRYCPKHQVGGLAARFEVVTRTIGNWARFLRESGFAGCQQPPRDAEDAHLSRRQGDYPYGVWRVLRRLPTKMMQRLQLFWRELQRATLSLVEQHMEQAARVEFSKLQAKLGHERAPRRKRRSELERESRRGELAAREAVRIDRRPGQPERH
jgi:hypothetical protein